MARLLLALPLARGGQRCAWTALALAWTLSAAACAAPMPQEIADAPQVAASAQGVVSAAQPLAAEAGARMLRAGGNAADAAVAAAFAVSVVEPSMNSIGGRTQILVRLPNGDFAGIDATTQAPATYDPETAPQASYGYATVGVPGAVAGLVRLLEEHGTMSLAEVMAPAIALAESGFHLLPGEAARHAAGAEQLREFPGSRAHYLDSAGQARGPGSLFVQPDLAETLRTIAQGGAETFYEGAIAQAMASDVTGNGGAVTVDALANYRAETSRIVRGSYRGYELVGTDRPAAGAIAIGVLHVLEHFEMAALAEPEWAALVATAMGRVFARAIEEGTGEATSKAWATEIAGEIELPGVEALPQAAAAAWSAEPEGAWAANSHTTHLSAGDSAGMFVSLTQTIGPNLGSKVATPGLGFLYAATLGGYLGRMEPGERAGSYIAPLMALRDGEPVLVLGAAGGSRIVSAVVQAILRVVDHNMTLPEALAAARVHPVPGGLAMETSPEIGWTEAAVEMVESWGLEVQTIPRAGAFGRVHGIQIDPATGEMTGVADPDWEGAAIVPDRR